MVRLNHKDACLYCHLPEKQPLFELLLLYELRHFYQEIFSDHIFMCLFSGQGPKGDHGIWGTLYRVFTTFDGKWLVRGIGQIRSPAQGKRERVELAGWHPRS